MHDKNYTDHSVEDLLHDQEFVATVLKYTTEEKWEQFLESHNESRANMNKARRLVHLFKVNVEQVQDERKFRLWKEIRSFDKEHVRKNKIRRLNPLIQIAASIIIILSIGSIAYLGLNRQKPLYQFAESNSIISTEYPVLKLADGEQIVLEKEDSEVKLVEHKNAIIINNERLVNIPSSGESLNELIVPFGKKSSLILSDGTKVWLNAGSRLAFPQKFEGKKRDIVLEGEGYFEVTKNKGQAFLVSTNDMEVEVLGTKFNLSAYNSDDFTETVLLEGSVNVRARDKLFEKKVLMSPNQKTVFSRIEKDISISSVKKPDMYISWIEGWYQFSKEDLTQVLKKIERHYDVTFSYDKSTITKALPITGKLDLNKSIDEVMLVLSGVAKIKYKIASDNLIIIN